MRSPVPASSCRRAVPHRRPTPTGDLRWPASTLERPLSWPRRSGFRLQGWLVDPSSRAEVGSLTLARASEAPEPVVKPLADPIPPEESRALADRLLEPYLRDTPENGDDRPKLRAISVLSEFDLDRALDLLQNGKFAR